jgi:hypothetical protein
VIETTLDSNIPITYLFGLDVQKAAANGADATIRVSDRVNFIFDIPGDLEDL